MSAPSPAQLRVLVDRAARRLSPEEGELLRAGFTALEAARGEAGGLQTALQTTRAELAAARGEVGGSDPVAPSRPVVPPLAASGPPGASG